MSLPSDSIPSSWEELVPHTLSCQVAIYGSIILILVTLLVMGVRKHQHRKDFWWDGSEHLRNLAIRQAKQKERDRVLNDGGH